MGAFKAGDRVKVVDQAFTERGMLGTVVTPSGPGVTYNRIRFDTELLSSGRGFNVLYLDRELGLALDPPRPPTPVRRPKGRFTVRQGRTLRANVNRYYASSLSAKRWYPR